MAIKRKASAAKPSRGYLRENPMKCTILAVFLLLALIGLLLSRTVKINYDLSDYLGDDTETSIALDIMVEEFGMTGNVQVMLSDIDEKTAREVKDILSDLEGALTVSFAVDDPKCYKDGKALYTILVDGEDHSDTAKNLISGIKTTLGEKFGKVELGGSTIEYNTLRENTASEMGLIIVVSILMAALLLLITASSWIEPLILLACSGIAIAINMGLNVFLGEISYITNSVSSILQLALSVDYSIVLLHTYRDEKKKYKNNTEAMRASVKSVFSPVLASAMTTVAGLTALLFMSFRIGFDIGIVLIKGIAISAMTAMVLLPVLVLMLDGLLEKTAKSAYTPGSTFFSRLAKHFSVIVVPVVTVLIIGGSVLQSFNTFGFTDSIGSNKNIIDTFGRNNSIVLVYPTGDDKFEDYEKELALKEILADYKNKDGVSPLASYTAYTTTVREVYDVNKAVSVLGLERGDVEMLFTMYNLYKDTSKVKLTTGEFISYTKELIASDPDVGKMIDSKTEDTIDLLSRIGETMSGSFNAQQLHAKLSSLSKTSPISLFAVQQMYGLYNYDRIKDPNIMVEDLLNYLINNPDKHPQISEMMDRTTTSQLKRLLGLYKHYPAAESAIKSRVPYTQFVSTLNRAISNMPTSSGTVSIDDGTIQQLYIMYFVSQKTLPNIAVNGRDFVRFVIEEAESNPLIGSQLTTSAKNSLNDLEKVDAFLRESARLDYTAMSQRVNRLQSSISSVPSGSQMDDEKISGVYIKYAIKNGLDMMTPMMAYELVGFIEENMVTNPLLSAKMTAEHHEKVRGAQEMITGAEGLFVADSYSRVLLSATVPAEGEEMEAFIEFLMLKAREVFGDGAHITGKVVSTYDLQAAFDLDNIIITVFTIVTMFLIILIIFKSLSLPVILVAVIQGAVWISLSLCYMRGEPVFFMSYIVTTCILMGATVDYGILMSNNYLVYRKTYDRSPALFRAVHSAMPTVFTSGIILVLCGFAISLISSQNSIASVGSLLAQGTITSIALITLALPSLLFLLDRIINKLTMSDEQLDRIAEKRDALLEKAAEVPAISAALAALSKAWNKVRELCGRAMRAIKEFARKNILPKAIIVGEKLSPSLRKFGTAIGEGLTKIGGTLGKALAKPMAAIGGAYKTAKAAITAKTEKVTVPISRWLGRVMPIDPEDISDKKVTRNGRVIYVKMIAPPKTKLSRRRPASKKEKATETVEETEEVED